MAILDVRKFPDKILRQKAEPVSIITNAERKLIEDMFDTMYFANGVGLAAPQVGIPKRIIACNPTGNKEDELAIINPKIISRSGKKVKECEGCLSIPGITGEIARYSKVKASGKNMQGQDIAIEAEGLLARIIDHETDHLDGVLFIDRMGFLSRQLLLNKYKKKVGVSCVGRWY